jgi:CBS domain-containing protein
MKARHLMSHDAECVSAADTLEEAARRLASAGVGAMPICGEDDRLKGMLTDRDIVVKAIAKGKDVARTLVSELAEGKPVTIGADDSVSEALRTMERAQVRRLPVIDGHRLVGMISAADVARRLPRRRSGRLLEAVSQPSSRSARGRIARIALVVAPLAGAAYVMRSRRSGKPGAVRQSTTVHVPVRSAYDQWTQFEEFPSFMEGVEQVRQVDDRHLTGARRSAASRVSGMPRSPSRCPIAALPGGRPAASGTTAWCGSSRSAATPRGSRSR